MTNFTWTDLDDKSVDVARTLAMDSVEKAGHGHPGTAMTLAPVAHILFQKFMNHSPNNPEWFGRDRFILSCGHASMLLYSQLYLNGYGLELEDLKKFRTLDSLTPGHPEYKHTKGVEMTTGPLGQGISSAVGMSISSRYWRNYFDSQTAKGESLFDNFIYVIASDGDLQEGVSAEASSLAGHLGLANLIVIYDDNKISIDGETSLAFTEDVAARYLAYGWDVSTVDVLSDGQIDVKSLGKAIENAKASSKPSFIRLKTVIAWPAPNAKNTAASHGAPLGESEIKLTKAQLGLNPEISFEVSNSVLEYTRKSRLKGEKKYDEWTKDFLVWASNNQSLANDFKRLANNDLVPDIAKMISVFDAGTKIASRKSGGTILNELASKLVELVGGSADLAESNGVALKDALSMQKPNSQINNSSIGGRYLHFGIREHAMASIMNGMALYGFTRPFGATFLIFSDYQKPAIRLASLMQLPVTYVWTHDSIGLGEDGPTHQPVEQLWSLRGIPGFSVVRPCDANEVGIAWLKILQDKKPAGIVLTRQNIETLDRNIYASAHGVEKGAYILQEAPLGKPDVILIATGSEVHLALAAMKELNSMDIKTRVVSMPCVEWFRNQTTEYQCVGIDGGVIGIDEYGASGKPDLLFEKYGITVAAIVQKAKDLKH